MIVHLGWIGSEPPLRFHAAAEATRRSCPDCEVMVHVGEDAIPQGRRAAMEARGLTPHMRSDIQRHAVLERYGGLWLDADVRLIVSPCEWASQWDRYTAVRLIGSGGPVGTDIIYVPPGWDGWPAVNDSIDRRLRDDRRLGVLDFASTMIRKLERIHPDLFTFVSPGDRWPYDPRTFTAASVVARGFDPPADPPPGLGDLVAVALSAVGITEARAQAVAQALGLEDCGCGRRRAAMNRLGAKLGLPPGRT